MNNGKPSDDKSPRRPTIKLISQAMDEARKAAVELHRQAGLKLAVWKDGRVQFVSPESIVEKTVRSSRKKR